MLCWRSVVFLFFVASTATSLEPPTNVILDGVISNGFRVFFNRTSNALSSEVKVEAKFLSEDVHVVNTSNTDIQITGLKSNVIYDVSVRSFDASGSASNYSSTKQARTYPNGSQVVVTIPSLTIFTVFLEVIPGAREWVIQVANQRTNNTQVEVVNSTYKIFRGQDPDTRYSIRARVSKIESTSLDEVQSPYGNWATVTTKQLSLYGRVIILGESNSSFDTAKWEQALYEEYGKNQPSVSSVKQLESADSSSPPGVLFHHEISISGIIVPDVSSLQLNNATLYSTLVVTEDVNPGYKYGILTDPTRPDLLLYLYYDNACSGDKADDWRYFSLQRNDGETKTLNLNTFTPESVKVSRVNYFEFSGLAFFNPRSTNRKVYMELQPNSLYSIDQSFLMKICQPTDTSSYLYTRRYEANNVLPATAPGYNNTFIYSTGPAQVAVDKISYTVSGNQQAITLKMPAVYRAHSYNFSIDGVGEIELKELDSSQYVEATLTGFNISQEYCINISATINHPDWRQETSIPSCFLFYSGSPASTTLRIVDVRSDSFTVTVEKVEFATIYIVEISNATNAWNHTTQHNLLSVNSGIVSGNAYNVRVAAQNPFGIGMFSESKSTKFWNFHDVTNSSMRLKWENESTDIRYEIGVTQLGTIFQRNINEFVIPDLQAGVLYDFNVSAIQNGSSVILFIDQQITAPGIPTNLRISSKTAFMMTVSWDFVTGAETYTVNINGRGIDNSTNTSSTFSTFENLFSGVKYTVGITAHNSAGASIRTTRDFITDFATPANISVSSVTSSSFVVTWESIRGADLYLIKVATISNGSSIITDDKSTTSSANISDLLSGTKYNISVIASYDEGESNRSEIFYQYTLLEIATNLRLVRQEETSLEIAWDFVNKADFYMTTLTGSINSVQNTTNTSAIFQNLLPNRGYNFEVAAVNNAGPGSGNTKGFFTVFQTPYNVSTSFARSNSFVVSWTGSGDARNFLITAATTSSGSDIITNISATISPVNFTALLSGAVYNVSVIAIYDEGRSDRSEISYQSTAPGTPTNVVQSSKNAFMLKVAWDTVTGAESYTIDITGKGTNTSTSTSSTFSKFDNLLSGVKYAIGVTAHNSAGSSIRTVGDFITDFATPANISVSSVTSSSFVVTWGNIKGADLYLVEVETNLNGSGIITNTTSNTSSVDISNLFSGTKYNISVIATYDEGKSDRSEIIYQFTRPENPTNLRLSKRKETYLEIAWDPVTGAEYYRVILMSMSAGQILTVQRPTNTSAIFENLFPNAGYDVEVAAINDAGSEGGISKIFFTVFQTPYNLSISVVRIDSFLVSWTGSENATNFLITASTTSGGSDIITNHTATTSPANITGLVSGAKYNVSVIAIYDVIYDVGRSDRSETIYQFTDFATPANISVSSVTSSSFVVTWANIKGVNSYLVEVETVSNGTSVITNTTSNTSSVDIPGLLSGKKYNVTVIAIYDEEKRYRSEIFYQFTLPGIPTNLRLLNREETSLEIAWDYVIGAGFYRVNVSGPINSVQNTTTPSAIFQNLPPNEGYNVEVAAVNDAGQGSVNTKRFFTVFQTPYNISISEIRGDSFVVSWIGSGDATIFLITATTTSGGSDSITNTSATTSPANITGLRPGAEYIVSVIAIYNEGRSDRSETIHQFTDFVTPADISLTSITSNSFVVSWEKINGIRLYMVEVETVSNGSSIITNATSNTSSVDITGLLSGKKYNVTVIAIYDGGKSVRSEIFYQFTHPESPGNLRLLKREETSLGIAWDTVTGADFYRVIVSGPINNVQNTTNSSAIFQNLLANKGYNVEVAAVNDAGQGSGNSKRFFTVFQTPYNISISDVRSDSYVVSWTGSGDATNFLITSVSSSGSGSIIFANTSPANITELLPETKYDVSVIAVYGEGQSDRSEITHQFTAKVNTTPGARSTPWWIFLIIVLGAIIFLSIIAFIIWCIRRKRNPSPNQQGFYDLQNPYRGDADDEVATDRLQMNKIEGPQGNIGPQGPDLENELTPVHQHDRAQLSLSTFSGGNRDETNGGPATSVPEPQIEESTFSDDTNLHSSTGAEVDHDPAAHDDPTSGGDTTSNVIDETPVYATVNKSSKKSGLDSTHISTDVDNTPEEKQENDAAMDDKHEGSKATYATVNKPSIKKRIADSDGQNTNITVSKPAWPLAKRRPAASIWLAD